MARPSLKGNVAKPQAAEAARKIAGGGKAVQEPATLVGEGADYAGEMETVSYHLPVELIELYRDLAEERLKLDRAQKGQARRQGEKPPHARRSALAIVREAMEAHRA
jgi:hypothetical protein